MSEGVIAHLLVALIRGQIPAIARKFTQNPPFIKKKKVPPFELTVTHCSLPASSKLTRIRKWDRYFTGSPTVSGTIIRPNAYSSKKKGTGNLILRVDIPVQTKLFVSAGKEKVCTSVGRSRFFLFLLKGSDKKKG